MRSVQTRAARLAALAVPAALGLTLLTGAPGVARPAAAPGLDAAAQQAGVLGALAGVTQPAAELVALAAKSPDGKVPEADATRLKSAVGTAIDKLKAVLPAAAETPAVAPGLPVTPPVGTPGKPLVGAPAARAQAGPADLVATAVANLKKSVDELASPAGAAAPAAGAPAPGVGAPAVGAPAPGVGVPAVGAPAPGVGIPAVGGTVPAPAADAAAPAQKVVKDTVNLVAATVLGSGLPAPDLEGLPKLPALGATATN
ncbi:hypothetical protein ACFP3U_14860 [Kitasatospora misakiensis]|uniref:Meckel syndrome type 1 protein n=1 Tax=Kitasatospora misakiensis TaxID=67330 RepID=A0ABW0X708_9ACTN